MVTYYEPENVESLAEAIGACMCRDRQAPRDQARRARAFLDAHGWERQGAEFVSMYQPLVEN